MKEIIAFASAASISTLLFWLGGFDFETSDNLSAWFIISFFFGAYTSAFFTEKKNKPNSKDFVAYFIIIYLFILVGLFLGDFDFSRRFELPQMLIFFALISLVSSAIYWSIIWIISRKNWRKIPH